jgi:hypothetical protein
LQPRHQDILRLPKPENVRAGDPLTFDSF